MHQRESYKITFSKSRDKERRHIGELIHSDISGPSDPPTSGEHRYFQVIIDDYSHFTIVKLLKNKSEAEENMIEYIKYVENQQDTKVKKI